MDTLYPKPGYNTDQHKSPSLLDSHWNQGAWRATPFATSTDVIPGYHTASSHNSAAPAAQAAIHSPDSSTSLYQSGLRANEAIYISDSDDSTDHDTPPSQTVTHAHDTMGVSKHHETFNSEAVSPQSGITHSGMPSNDVVLTSHAAQASTGHSPQLNTITGPATLSTSSMKWYKIAQLAMYNMHYITSDPRWRRDAMLEMLEGQPIHLIKGSPFLIADRSNVSLLSALVLISTDFSKVLCDIPYMEMNMNAPYIGFIILFGRPVYLTNMFEWKDWSAREQKDMHKSVILA
jgi:hypothetical protein